MDQDATAPVRQFAGRYCAGTGCRENDRDSSQPRASAVAPDRGGHWRQAGDAAGTAVAGAHVGALSASHHACIAEGRHVVAHRLLPFLAGPQSTKPPTLARPGALKRADLWFVSAFSCADSPSSSTGRRFFAGHSRPLPQFRRTRAPPGRLVSTESRPCCQT